MPYSVITAFAVAPVISTLIIPAIVTTVISAITRLFLITRNILALIPVVSYKADPLAAGVVFAAVLAPIVGVARR